MQRTSLLFLFFYSVAMSGFGQAKDTTICLGQKNCLEQKDFKKVVNQQFSKLVTGQSATSVGNFASLDLGDAEVSFAGNTITKKGNVFGLKATGGVSDGLFAVFSNSKLNSNLSLEFQAQLINLNKLNDAKKTSLTWYTESLEEYHRKRDEITNNFRIKRIEATDSIGLTLLKYKREELKESREKIETEIKEEKEKKEKNLLRIDSLGYAKNLNISELERTDSLIAQYPKDFVAVEIVDQQRALELKKIKLDLEMYAFDISWFSFGYKVSSNSFRYFDPTLTFADQVKDTNYVSHEVRAQYSRYNWTKAPYKTFFYCAGAAFSVTDNFGGLTQKEITEVSNYGPNINDRSTTKKYNAYMGDYVRGKMQVRLFGDYYRFLFDENVAALHVNPEFLYQEGEKPIYNLGFGFMFSFIDSKKEDKSKVNAEIFYNFNDLAKNSDTELSFFERNTIGLRFSFPINFINK